MQTDLVFEEELEQDVCPRLNGLLLRRATVLLRLVRGEVGAHDDDVALVGDVRADRRSVEQRQSQLHERLQDGRVHARRLRGDQLVHELHHVHALQTPHRAHQRRQPR